MSIAKNYPIHLEIQTHRKNPVGILRSSFRQAGKMVHQTHGRLVGLHLSHLKMIQAAFRNQVVPIGSADGLRTYKSKEYGASAALLQLTEQIGLERILYSRKLPWVRCALAMIVGRLVYAGSKLSLVNRWEDTALWELVGIKDRPQVEQHCYEPMDELIRRQPAIQRHLVKKHLGDGDLVLYDITSSYFEGEYNGSEIVNWGYKRDKKAGRKQIVIGLLCNRQGCPVAVEVFSGNTKDETTVIDKINQLRKNYGLQRLIFVGDRGMVTKANYDKVKDIKGLNTISALTHPEILDLINRKNIQPELFDEKQIIEVSDPRYPNRRLCLCRNNATAKREGATRKALLANTTEYLNRIALTTTQQVTSQKTIGIRIGRVFKQYRMGKFVKTEIVEADVGKRKKKGKVLKWWYDYDKIETEKLIDGCYIIASDVPAGDMDKDDTVQAYKSLAMVEKAFRNIKTVSLEIRPFYHKTEQRIKAHVFICMLAYYLQWHISQRINALFVNDQTHEDRRWTFEGVIDRLKSIRRKKAQLNGAEFDHTDIPDDEQNMILELLQVKL